MAVSTQFELWPTSGLDEVQTIIRAVYRQVLGNPHVMESERLVAAESQLCDRAISVREFVRAVAKSALYRTRYFESCAPYRFVEVNFKHLLGRAPQDQREVSEHIIRCVAEGYEAEIDSYIDSDEYQAAFGENVVPYYRGQDSAANSKQVGYIHSFALDRGPAQIDSATKASQLVYAVATNTVPAVKPSTSRGGASSVAEKTFKILVSGSKFDSPRRTSNTEYIVSGSKMTPQIQRIHRAGGKIVKITEVI
ncbi:photosystem I reaction center subunit XII [Synechococcales cyanobacterium C]|uniref:Photosystem I reaction center subunit XII n=1 Tax=Petrachloros mirabilis ULC683 TaxID=2781853 RepID=A0A8K2A7L9_9CYAN|nr:phycobilisome rod-core linker polypeptide [Petrachloros mirabilis]NCJ06095.1 photosystem I reaction center subunit XII [Petrachloros mirabilis ULC683]